LPDGSNTGKISVNSNYFLPDKKKLLEALYVHFQSSHMKWRIRLSFLVFLFLGFYSGLAQNSCIRFYKLDSLNGTKLGRITGITQDPVGIMWFSGADQRCLYRYDGNMLTSFRRDANNPNSLGLNSLETIYADDQGLIWIGGDGLDQYNPKTGIFRHFTHNDHDISSITNGGVYAILKDHRGNIWVGTDNGLDRLDQNTGKFIHYRNDSSNSKSLSNNTVNAIYEDKKGVLWIGTGIQWSGINGDGGLNRMDSVGAFTRYLHDPKNPNILLSNKIRSIFEDSRGNFWVGTSGDGLHTMDRDKETFERHLYNPKHPNQLSGPILHPGPRAGAEGITYIYEDKTGAIWIGSYLEGLSRYDAVTKEMTRYKIGNGFPDSTTYRGFISKDGTLWVAADDSRLLYRADPNSKTITNVHTEKQVWGILADHGQIWVGTWGGGLLQFDENRSLIHRFKHDPKDPSSILNDTIWTLYKNPEEDVIWVGTNKGIEILNTVSKKFSRFTLGKDQNGIDQLGPKIFQDKNRNLWIGTSAGLIRYNRNDGSVRQWLSDPKDSTSIGSNLVNTILEDEEGNIWVGTWGDNGGIWKLNSKSGKFHSYFKGISCRILFEDRSGVFWTGTQQGFFRYDKREDKFLAFFDAKSSISNLPTSGILEDQKNNLWVVAAASIIKINPERNNYFLFGNKYGITLPRNGVLSGFLCMTSGEQMLVGNDQGFYAFYPEELDADMRPLKLDITDFFFSTGSGLAGTESYFLNSAEKRNELSLGYNQNNFGFRYSVYDYRPPGVVRYYTMLENYDPVWRQSGTDKTVYYFNLAPGDYVFRVMAFNGDEKKGERRIRIHISPPWWKTWWAYSLYGILLATAIFGFVRFQKQQIIHQERMRTQTKELAQAKEIEKAYTELKSTQAQLIQSEKMASLGELTAGIAHEIQNPLNFVNNFSEVNLELAAELKVGLAKLNISDQEKNELEEIANNINENEGKINHHGRRADAIVKGMLQHSRISSGQKEPTDINQLADEYLRLAYHGLRAKDKAFNTTMKTEFDPEIGKVNIVSQDIGRVLLNLYNNAFYAVAEKQRQAKDVFEPLVDVSTKRIGKNIEITVRDNGSGIPKKVLDKIFQPFFTTKPAGQGTGLGLSLSFDVVKAHGGELKVETKEGQYTSFSIILPV
jgi:signal transduction histidine kinase/ligand-binding sensor domain-containing protein